MFDADGNVAYERTTCEAVEWDNFRIGPAKVWDKVPWIAFRHYLTREQCIALNEKIGGTIPLDSTVDGYKDEDSKGSGPPEVFKRLMVWEIWDKEQREVLFIAPSYADKPLKKEEDTLKLEGFFPIPRPIYAIATSNSLVPVELYRVYKDQADELDRITRRIMALTNVLKARGIYASPMSDAFEQLSNAEDGNFVPSDNVEQFTQNGGLDRAIWNWPIETVVGVIRELYTNREQTKQVIYEVTGIADIMRGSTQKQETATAQQIKAQWGSLRIQNMQAEVSRYARDLIRLKAEIISEHFSPQTLSMMTGIEVTPEMMQIMRSDLMRSYRIDIETDSTIRADVTRAQEQISQFIQGTGTFFQAIGPAVAGGGMPKDVAIDLYSSFARVFKLGRQAEDALERWAEMGKQPQPEMPQGPSPEQMAAQQQAMQMQADMQAKAQESQGKMQLEAAKANASAEIEKAKLALEAQKHQDNMQLEMVRAQNDAKTIELKVAELRIKEAEIAGKMGLEQARFQAEQCNMMAEKAEGMGEELEAEEPEEKQPQMIVVAPSQMPEEITIVRDINGRVMGATKRPANGAPA
jgi:hypothetical protein